MNLLIISMERRADCGDERFESVSGMLLSNVSGTVDTNIALRKKISLWRKNFADHLILGQFH